MRLPDVTRLDFDIDRYLNRFIPRSRIHRLPKPVSHFLGYRSAPSPPIGNVLVWVWSFLGAVCGLLVVEAVFRIDVIKARGAPIIIGSLGASAILEYNTIDSPLSQPRNVLFGQLLSSLVGVCIAKLMQLSPPSTFENVRFVGGALAVGLSSALMGMTKTIHPPAGATALLAVTSDEITQLGWFLIPLVGLGSVLMLAVACILNNIQRRFPVYWWTPADLSKEKRIQKKQEREQASQLQKKVGSPEIDVDVEKAAPGFRKESQPGTDDKGDNEDERTRYDSSSETDSPHHPHSHNHPDQRPSSSIPRTTHLKIIISPKEISLPSWISLDPHERAMLEILKEKLCEGLGSTTSRESEVTKVGDQ